MERHSGPINLKIHINKDTNTPQINLSTKVQK